MQVIAIAEGDPLFSKLNDIGDVETHMPDKVSEVREWFRSYKTHEGKPLNEFGLNEEVCVLFLGLIVYSSLK